MAYHYHHDPLLPLEFKAIFWASYFLLKEYESTLKIQKEGQVHGKEKTLVRCFLNWFVVFRTGSLLFEDIWISRILNIMVGN